MADTQTYYDSSLTGEELDAALKKLPQVDAAAEQCARNVQLAQSWAEGGTGIREGEDLNCARYWCAQAQTIANGCLGWYTDEEQLKTVHPTGQNGQWAILGATNSLWLWDEQTEAWVDSGTRMDPAEYYTRDQTQTFTPFLYKATFLLDAWSGKGPYTQTVALKPVDGGPAVTAGSISVTAGIDNSLPDATKTELQAAAGIVNNAKRTLGAGTIAVSAGEKPAVDTEIYFWVKKGSA